ncbi:restriction endonuclease subunit S [Mobiluncus mulieris]|nr:restriction endonuclease subunit S [Mobiluncus mulieris]NMW82175.1 restriction endonuclease subunit S [Mobiluncus mulieris]
MPSKPQFVGECRRVKLNEICTKGKSSLRQKDVFNDGSYSVYGASGVVGTTCDYQNEIPYVAVVKDGAGVGRTSACEAMTSVLGTMQALIPNSNVERDYLLHLVRSLRLGEGFSGSTIPHIYFKDYGRIEVPLPSLEAQNQIVSQLGLVEAQITQAEAQIEQLDSLVKSRFVEMFGDPKLEPNKWEVKPLGDVCSTRLGKMLDAKRQTGECSYPYLANTNVQWFHFELSDLRRMDFSDEDRVEFALTNGDVLVTEGGEIGRCAIWREELKDCYFQKAVHRVRCNADCLLPEYFTWCFKMKSDLGLFEPYASRSTIAHLTGKKIKQVPIPLPPLALQKDFVTFVTQVDKSRFVYLGSERNEVLSILDVVAYVC